MLENLKKYEHFNSQSTCFYSFFRRSWITTEPRLRYPGTPAGPDNGTYTVSRSLIAIDAIIILTHHKKSAVQGYSQPYHTLTKQCLCLMLFIVRKSFALNQSHLLRTAVFVQKEKQVNIIGYKSAAGFILKLTFSRYMT